MALASVQGSAEVSAQVDAYLLEVYRQAAEATPPTPAPGYARLAGFLSFVGLLTAALAVMVSLPEGVAGGALPQGSMTLGVIGLLVSIAFSAQELRVRRTFGVQSDNAAAFYTTSSIYNASTGFFAVIVLISTALLFVR